MRIWDTPTIWTHPSGIEGIDITEYWDYGHPELLPDDARSRTYKNKRTDPDEPVSIPTRATAVIEKAAVVVDGKVVKSAVYKQEVVPYAEYTALAKVGLKSSKASLGLP